MGSPHPPAGRQSDRTREEGDRVWGAELPFETPTKPQTEVGVHRKTKNRPSSPKGPNNCGTESEETQDAQDSESDSSEMNLPVFSIDNIRPLASPNQLRQDPVAGLRVSGMSFSPQETGILFEDLEQDTAITLPSNVAIDTAVVEKTGNIRSADDDYTLLEEPTPHADKIDGSETISKSNKVGKDERVQHTNRSDTNKVALMQDAEKKRNTSTNTDGRLDTSPAPEDREDESLPTEKKSSETSICSGQNATVSSKFVDNASEKCRQKDANITKLPQGVDDTRQEQPSNVNSTKITSLVNGPGNGSPNGSNAGEQPPAHDMEVDTEPIINGDKGARFVEPPAVADSDAPKESGMEDGRSSREDSALSSTAMETDETTCLRTKVSHGIVEETVEETCSEPNKMVAPYNSALPNHGLEEADSNNLDIADNNWLETDRGSPDAVMGSDEIHQDVDGKTHVGHVLDTSTPAGASPENSETVEAAALPPSGAGLGTSVQFDNQKDPKESRIDSTSREDTSKPLNEHTEMSSMEVDDNMPPVCDENDQDPLFKNSTRIPVAGGNKSDVLVDEPESNEPQRESAMAISASGGQDPRQPTNHGVGDEGKGKEQNDSSDISELEKQLMARLEDEIAAAEEQEWLQMGDEEIMKLEEEDAMSRVAMQIAEEEELEKENVKKRPVGILEVDSGEGFDGVLNRRRKKSKPSETRHTRGQELKGTYLLYDMSPLYAPCCYSHIVIFVAITSTITKVVPRKWKGRKFIEQEDMLDLTGSHSSLSSCFPVLKAVKGDPNSWQLTIFTGLVDRDKCMRCLGDWLLKMIFRYNVLVLEETGDDLDLVIDPTKSIGAKVRCCDSKVMLTSGSVESCAVAELKPALSRGGFLITTVEGTACESIDVFKCRLDACKAAGIKVRIRGKRPSSDVPFVTNKASELIVEEDLPVPPPDNPLEVAHTEEQVLPNTPFATETTAESVSSPATEQDPPASSASSGNRCQDTSPLVEDTSRVSNSSTGGVNAPQIPTRAFGDPLAKAAYQHFEKKYKRLAEIEYKNAGVKVRATISSMWRQHKEKFGKTCDDNCPCVFSIDFLTSDVLRDKLKPNKNWNNPLGLKADSAPVGFTRRFCTKFRDPLKSEYPGEKPMDILNRLYEMWQKHESTRSFGLKCTESCDCINGWETVFNRGLTEKEATKAIPAAVEEKSKTKRTGAPGGHMANRTQTIKKRRPTGSSDMLFNRGSINRPYDGDERIEYEVSFVTTEPMGYYFMTKETDGAKFCQVTSVCPVTAEKRDDRIQQGTTVVAVETKNGRIPIQKWESLKQSFQEARRVGEPLRVIFINGQSSDEISVIQDSTLLRKVHFHEDWSKNGKWRGSLHETGWAGGAGHVARKPSERRRTRSNPCIGTSSSNASKVDQENSQMERTEPPTNEIGWKKITSKRALQRKPRKYILVKEKNLQRVKKRVNFSEKDEEREYEVESNTHEFFVESGKEPEISSTPLLESSDCPRVTETDPEDEVSSLPSSLDVIRKAIESGTVSDTLELFESGLRKDITDSDLDSIRISMNRTCSDFETKEVILKIFINAGVQARISQTLKCREFRVYVESVNCTLEGKPLKRDDMVVRLSLEHHSRNGRQDQSHECLAEMNAQDISPDRHIAVIHRNDETNRRQLFEVEVKRKATKESLGIAAVIVQTSDTGTSSNECSFETRHAQGQVKLRVERYGGVEYVKDKRKQSCKKLSDIMNWIKLFNLEEQEQSSDLRLSVEVPIRGTTLLHTAVLLAEAPLVQKLLDRGAKVTEAVRKLVEKGVEDGFSREEIARLIRSHPSSANVLPDRKENDASRDTMDSNGEDEVEGLGGDTSSLPFDWMFQTERAQRYKTRCSDFDAGVCRRGETCWNAHVHDPGKSHSTSIARRFSADGVIVETRTDIYGKAWHTSGYVDGNAFFYAVGDGGVECKQTGVFWYTTAERARGVLCDRITNA